MAKDMTSVEHTSGCDWAEYQLCTCGTQERRQAIESKAHAEEWLEKTLN